MKHTMRNFCFLVACAGLVFGLALPSYANDAQSAIDAMGFGANAAGGGDQDLVVIRDPHAAGGIGVNTGVGAHQTPPAASDGPKIPVPTASIGLSDEENLGIFGALMVGDEDLAMDIWFSGTTFGDEVGVEITPAMGGPGNPLGGPPVGSWVHFDRSRFSGQSSQSLEDLRQDENFKEIANIGGF